MIFTLQMVAAVALDGVLGDPRWFPHPVRGIGALCRLFESLSRRIIKNAYVAGLITAAAVIGITAGIVFLVLVSAASWSPYLEALVGVFLLYTTIAGRDLLRHSMDVYAQLKVRGNLENARIAVARIVGRDTTVLDESGVCRASIETVAENMVDGITAPIFYAVLAACLAPFTALTPLSCAVVGAFCYKAVNTMDSMIGYKSDKYLKFGRFAAKLDDLVNFIPARISGICLIAAAFLLRLDYKGAMKIFLRDRLAHASPNAGHTEAAAAGALGVRLCGPSMYFNKIVKKPFLGENIREVESGDIKATNRLVIVGSLIFVITLIICRIVFLSVTGKF